MLFGCGARAAAVCREGPFTLNLDDVMAALGTDTVASPSAPRLTAFSSAPG